MKIYSDTDALLNNARHSDDKTQLEREALIELLTMHKSGDIIIHQSLVVYRELIATANEDQRKKLLADYEELKKVENDQRLLGFNTVYDHLGGFTCSPMIADIQDEQTRDRLMQRGLKQKDAEHLAQAIYNKCGVFLTRDEATIIRPHRAWIEKEFVQIKIRLPSELLRELKASQPQ